MAEALEETRIIMDGMIARLYIESIFFFIVGVVYIFFVFRKKRWVKWENVSFDFKESVKRNEKKDQYCCKVFPGNLYRVYVV